MSDYIDTFCPACDAEVRAPLHSQAANLSVRGETVSFIETIAVCPLCGGAVGDARIEGANIARAHAAYRALHGIMAPEEIATLRASYGLSLREFSMFLGFGEQTAYRYERGDIPDQTHNTTLVSAETVEGARLLLIQNRSRLSAKSVAKIERRIQAMSAGARERPQPSLTIEARAAEAPSAANGYRRLDFDRVAALVYTLASNCRDLYWTKLQKAVFFTDMICFEQTSRSLTGLTYAHATHGPVMDHKDEVRYLLVEYEIIDFRERGWGEVLVPESIDVQPFNPAELALIDQVAAFINTFSSSSELSSFSHKLSCWNRSANGEIIEYMSIDGEVSRAIRERMEALGDV